MKPPQVIVAGSYNRDLTWTTSRVPAAGETTTGHFRGGHGGKGSNQAIACARAGALTAYIGAVGDDPFGAAMPAFYDAEGIVHHLAIKAEAPTGNAGIWIDKSGENRIIVDLGANALLAVHDVPDGLVESARMVVCQHETDLAFNHALFSKARRAGVRTLLNTAPMRLDFDPGILSLTDILVPNETEFAALLRLLDVEDLEADTLASLPKEEMHVLCRKVGVETVLVTLGSRGSFVSTPETFQHIPACAGVTVVDSTGAGDCFVGAVAAALCDDKDILEAAKFGTAAAAVCVGRHGIADAMPRLLDIQTMRLRMDAH